jgi:hypothetical protein
MRNSSRSVPDPAYNTVISLLKAGFYVGYLNPRSINQGCGTGKFEDGSGSDILSDYGSGFGSGSSSGSGSYTYT